MTDDDRQQRDPDPDRPEPPRRHGLRDDGSPLAGLFRAFKLFLAPFLLSWAVAYVGSARDLEWLYFTGLGGVGLSMIVLLVWLIH